MNIKRYNLLKYINWQNCYGTQTITITATIFKETKRYVLQMRIANELDIDVSAVKVEIRNLLFYFSK